jgi:hypothetical protein
MTPALEHPDEDDIDLHCLKRRHGVIKRGQIFEVHCRWCSSVNGAPTFHRWKVPGGVAVADRIEDVPKPRKRAA